MMILSTTTRILVPLCFLFSSVIHTIALDRQGAEFKVFQFPADAIPSIDGDDTDWDIVPASYAVGTDELREDSGKYDGIRPDSLDISVKVGWVKGMSRLYFLYEAYDDYWDFALPGLKNDTFEIVVDGDLSGGPLVDKFRHNEEVLSQEDAYFVMHGKHAQNYHIFTPARDKSWAMYWGPAQWLKELPYANAAYHYDFKPGEAGQLTLEFWVTLFDNASEQGPSHSELSELVENQLIGLAWAIIDYDDVESSRNNGFWNLSRSHTMYGQASELVGFRLMPLEPEYTASLKAHWSFGIIDRERRLVSFKDESTGEVESWEWSFGDGETSQEQHPIHMYKEAGHYVVMLTVKSVEDSSSYSRVWDVTLP